MTGCADYLRFMTFSASYLTAGGVKAAADGRLVFSRQIRRSLLPSNAFRTRF
jgi:hypothetical protein